MEEGQAKDEGGDFITHYVQDIDIRVDKGDLTLNSLFAPADPNADNSLLLAAENNLNLPGELDLYSQVRKILYGRNLTVGSIANEDELSFGSTVSLDAISVFIDDLSPTLSTSVIQSLALDNPTFEGYDSHGGLLELAQMTESQLNTLFKYGLFTGYSYFLQAPDKSAKLSDDLSEAGGSSPLFGGRAEVTNIFSAAGSDLGSGWRSIEWFGFYFPHSSGWFYHLDHGWIYSHAESMDSIWYWHQTYKWCWTNQTVYPWVWFHDEQGWKYYYMDSKKWVTYVEPDPVPDPEPDTDPEADYDEETDPESETETDPQNGTDPEVLSDFESETTNINPPSGSLLWEFSTNWVGLNSIPLVFHGLASFQGVTFFGDGENLLRLRNGWVERTERVSQTQASFYPMIGKNMEAYYGSEKVYSQNWDFNESVTAFSTALDEESGTLYLNCMDGRILALDSNTGSKIWEVELGAIQFDSLSSDSLSWLALSGENLFATNTLGELYALNAETGEQVWKYSSLGNLGPLALGPKGEVYVSERLSPWEYPPQATVLAFDGSSGMQTGSSFEPMLIAPLVSPVVDSEGKVYVATINGNIVEMHENLSPIYGDYSGVQVTEGAISTTPALGSDGTLYFAINNTDSLSDSKIIAINGTTQMWEYSMDGIVTNPLVLDQDGVLYFTSSDIVGYSFYKVHALQASSGPSNQDPWPMHGQNSQRTGKWVPIIENSHTAESD